MPSRELPAVLAAYRAGLERQLEALDRLERLARVQREAALHGDLEQVLAASADRAVVWAEIAAEEDTLSGARFYVHDHLDAARTSTGFAHIVERHRVARARLDAITAADRDTMERLEHDTEVRRRLVRSLEAGEATLAAYRRVTSRAASSAELVDRRG